MRVRTARVLAPVCLAANLTFLVVSRCLKPISTRSNGVLKRCAFYRVRNWTHDLTAACVQAARAVSTHRRYLNPAFRVLYNGAHS
jgi:hypothetical protein